MKLGRWMDAAMRTVYAYCVMWNVILRSRKFFQINVELKLEILEKSPF